MSESAVYQAAVRLLSRREHSTRELREKLIRKGWPREITEPVLSRLQEDGLQSDERFAESFVRSRVARCHGPLKIRAALQQRGIHSPLTDNLLSPLEHRWPELALQALGTEIPARDDRDGRARAYRRLCRRGFTHAQAMTALQAGSCSTNTG